MIPVHTKDILDRYVQRRYSPGGFLTCVLSNDLFGAVAQADEENRAALPDIVSYIYCNLPAMAWGNRETVRDYLRG